MVVTLVSVASLRLGGRLKQLVVQSKQSVWYEYGNTFADCLFGWSARPFVYCGGCGSETKAAVQPASGYYFIQTKAGEMFAGGYRLEGMYKSIANVQHDKLTQA